MNSNVHKSMAQVASLMAGMAAAVDDLAGGGGGGSSYTDSMLAVSRVLEQLHAVFRALSSQCVCRAASARQTPRFSLTAIHIHTHIHIHNLNLNYTHNHNRL